MDGNESLNWHPLVADFIVLGRKLEQLGFIYNRGEIVVFEELFLDMFFSARG
jgi:hypothetical protein